MLHFIQKQGLSIIRYPMFFIIENKFSSSRLKLKSRKEIRFDFIVFTNKTVNYNMDSTFGDKQ